MLPYRVIPKTLASLIVAVGLAAGCGIGEASTTNESQTTTSEGATDAGALPNSCPAEGCRIFITDATADPTGELVLTFDANFTPDFERNHIHVFWDSQEPGAVSSDYLDNGYDVQGQWHPTDDYPSYLTQSQVSVTAPIREGSTTVCVTAADTDHAVIDPGLAACRDVGDLLG